MSAAGAMLLPTLAVLLPAAAALLFAVGPSTANREQGSAPWRRALLAFAPMPLLLAGATGAGEASFPHLLFGFGLAVDAVNQPLLLLAGLGWSIAGAHAGDTVGERARSFGFFWMATLAGQALALLGTDLATFYLGYVAMTLAAYGLVVHARSEEAWRAGRVYLVLAFAGEALVLSGLLTIGATHGNAAFAVLAREPVASLPALMMCAGFAVKLGAVPLHVWLPLAHPVAPVPASAVLSGVLVKAGLLGMLRFAPPAPDWSGAIVAAGLFCAAYGAIAGLAQARLKTVLAYSTISQMGLAIAGIGAWLAAGLGREAALAALGLFALHHGLNKIALFLAAGHSLNSPLAHAAFLLPAAALAGLPPASGHLAKIALKDALDAAGLHPWAASLALSSALTTALMLHAWRLAAARNDGSERIHPAWALAVLAGVALPWLWAARAPMPALWSAAILWSAIWPLLLGAALFVGLRRLRRRPGSVVPEGDVVVWYEAAARSVLRAGARAGEAWTAFSPRAPDLWPSVQHLRSAEVALARLPIAGLCLLGVLLLLWALLG